MAKPFEFEKLFATIRAELKVETCGQTISDAS